MKQNMPSTTATTIQATVLSPSIAKVVNVPRPRAKGFIIELLVQVICANPNGWHYEYSHMGYMKKIFKQKSGGVKKIDHVVNIMFVGAMLSTLSICFHKRAAKSAACQRLRL